MEPANKEPRHIVWMSRCAFNNGQGCATCRKHPDFQPHQPAADDDLPLTQYVPPEPISWRRVAAAIWEHVGVTITKSKAIAITKQLNLR